jgi:hypothetical protein
MITFSRLGRYGRIGNAMFQIASTIGIAKRLNYEFGFPYWYNYDHRDRFGGNEDIDIQKWFKNPLPEMIPGEYQTFHIKWGFHLVSPPDWSDIHGHMQCEDYFKHCEDTVRHYFEFKNQSELRSNTVAVHFRGLDYGGDYHPRCSPEYYAEALKRFDGLDVLIFSDEPETALKTIGRGEVVTGNHSMVDLELISRCSHHIISNSTYSWWGAWLSGSKNVIVPKRWFGKQAKILSDDIYCKGWIVI